MKYFDHYKVQLYFESSPIDLRRVCWRVVPSELSWWKRIFCNNWKYLYQECCGEMNPMFSPKDQKKLSKLKTYKDIKEFLNNEINKARIRHYKRVELGIEWADKSIF